MICVTIDDDAVWIHNVDDPDNPIDITDEYEVSMFPVDDGDPKTLISGFHIGRRMPRAEVLIEDYAP